MQILKSIFTKVFFAARSFTTTLYAQSECISKTTPSSNPRLPVEIAHIIFSSQTQALVKTYNVHHGDLTDHIWSDIENFKPSINTKVRLEYANHDDPTPRRRADVINDSTNAFLGVLVLENETMGSLARTYSDGAVSIFQLICRY